VVKVLQRRSRATTSAVRERERAEMVLARLDGFSVTAAAEKLGTTPKRVSAWTKRFEREGLAGLEDRPGRGRRPSIPESKVARVITEATRPPKPRTRWSLRTMARHAGVSATSVHRIWSRNDLKPHVITSVGTAHPDRHAPFPAHGQSRLVVNVGGCYAVGMREKPTPPTLAQLHQAACWGWLGCQNVQCLHTAPTALAPLIMRWGPDASSDRLRRSARCSRCGRRGATLQHPGWAGSEIGMRPFPADCLAVD
jgi:transposase